MEFITGVIERETADISDIISGEMGINEVAVHGIIHSIRDMSGFSFLILRRFDGLIQCVLEQEAIGCKQSNGCLQPIEKGVELREGDAVLVKGIIKEEERAPFGFELLISYLEVLSEPAKDAIMPLPINKWKLNTSLETKLSLRGIALRNIRERAIFKIQEGIVKGFRNFLFREHFTEIRTPKIVAGNAEGGANVFKLDYFGKKAYLAQSPQFYKQTMVGVYDRVFEAAPVFRAEKHNTTRHLNEYTSLDFEMGYISSFYSIMVMETAILQYIFSLLEREYKRELDLLNIQLPEISSIPFVRFEEAKELVSKKYSRKIKDPYDLEPEEEVLIGKYFKEEFDSDFVFVTHYPSKKRPFYAMDDPDNPKFTLSFDLLFKGMEVTTGGQRIHSYEEQVKKMVARGMNIEEFSDYLMLHQYGVPPHGGLGIGLERFTMKLLDEQNIRETTLFPRDVSRLEP